MGSLYALDQPDICFDDTHAVANAGLLAATLAERLGIEQVADALIDLGERAGAYRPGRKLLTLVHSMLAGGDCVDDADLLRCGATSQVLGQLGRWVRPDVGDRLPRWHAAGGSAAGATSGAVTVVA